MPADRISVEKPQRADVEVILLGLVTWMGGDVVGKNGFQSDRRTALSRFEKGRGFLFRHLRHHLANSLRLRTTQVPSITTSTWVTGKTPGSGSLADAPVHSWSPSSATTLGTAWMPRCLVIRYEEPQPCIRWFSCTRRTSTANGWRF